MRTSHPGLPMPLGATWNDHFWNFAVVSPYRISHLILGDYQSGVETKRIPLNPQLHRTGNVWHICVEALEDELLYGYQVCDNPSYPSTCSIAYDPYAKLLKTGHEWNNSAWKTRSEQSERLIGVAYRPHPFPWKEGPQYPRNKTDRIIYEAHIRGMTKSHTSDVLYPGTFLGAMEKVDYLQSLGISAIELLPIFEWNESEWMPINPITKQPLCNYWGYSPLSFFSPMQRYGSSDDPIQTSLECKKFIDKCHSHNIEVILDVVYNHTGEGNECGPSYSYKILDKESYYLIDIEGGRFSNYSGCGNTLNVNHPLVSEMIISSLRHWVTEYRIDGFRFDLASIFVRGQTGTPMHEPPLIEAIAQDPLLQQTLLISEPWDAAGLYHTGAFYRMNQAQRPLFPEWNDRYRDEVRQFIRGDLNSSGPFATRLSGSSDLYGKNAKASINYVTAHDGFCLTDLVSYTEKHNFGNGENNTDGAQVNYSWNCGTEGPTACRSIVRLREMQRKNFLTALLMSQGTPMLLMGDEYGHSKGGNNNTWCQDNPINWFDWSESKNHPQLSQLIAILCKLRKESGCFDYNRPITEASIRWHGKLPNKPCWNEDNHLVAFTLHDQKEIARIFVAFNSATVPIEIEIPEHHLWRVVVRSSQKSPRDLYDLGQGPRIAKHISLGEHSCLILYHEDL